MHVRVCVECGEEYRPEVAVCADCGGALADRHDEGEGWTGRRPRAAPGADEPSPERPPEPPPSDYAVVHSGPGVAEEMALVHQLDEAGVPVHLRADPPRGGSPPTWYIYVPQAELQHAREILAPLFPGDPDPHLLDKIHRDFDPEFGYRRCPACDAGLRPGVAECPSCGLTVGGDVELVCTRCGKEVAADQRTCPGCGASEAD